MYSPWRRYAQSSLETMLSIYLAKSAKTVSEFFLFALVVLSQKYFLQCTSSLYAANVQGAEGSSSSNAFFPYPLAGIVYLRNKGIEKER